MELVIDDIIRAYLGGGVLLSRKRLPSARLEVCDDWIRALPREKGQVFESVVHNWECSYAMLSVALDDAFSFRACGELICARQEACISADLLERLSDRLVNFCEIAARHGRKIASVPAVEPMRTEFFRGDTGQSAASWNSILHHVLMGERSRFLHKVRILSATIRQLAQQFLATVEEVARGSSTRPTDAWKTLDSLHYDFNTCLREAEIVLKSFLRSFPAEELETFATELETRLPSKAAKTLAGILSRPASA